MKKILKYVAIYIFMICILILMLTLTSMIPKEILKEKVSESADILCEEGNRKLSIIPYKNIIMQFDNYSDALMINTAYSIDPETPLYSAMVARKNYSPEITESVEPDSEKELKSASKYQYHNEVGELRDLANEDITESFEYARYWHGYLVVLRPLLTFANVQTIRIILILILVLLSGILLYQLNKKINWVVSMIFLFGLISIEYFYIGISLQSSFCFLIMMISSIIILMRGNKIKDISMIFFITGILTNFFDLLTVPCITYGIPLLIYFITIAEEKNITIKELIIIFLKTGIAWAIGYALTWFIKWLLVDLLYNRNLIAVALKQVVYRSAGSQSFGYIKTLEFNTQYIEYFIYALIIGVALYVEIEAVLKNKKPENIIGSIPYFLIGIIPFVWIFLIRDHSYKHSFFTYRNFILTMIGLPMGCYYLFNKKIKDKEQKD